MSRKITGELRIQYREALNKLKPDISTQDRIDAIKELCIADGTLRQYFSGYVTSIDTAEKLVDFFSKRINARKAKLSEILN